MKVNQFMPYIGLDEYEAIKPCFEDNWITEGPKSKQFETELLELTGSKYGVFAQNGTLALYLGLKAMGIGPGDEVIVPNFTFIASANAVEMCGAKPVFVDSKKSDLQIDIRDCERAVNKNTKAIMPVHVFGLSANMDEVMDFATNKGLKVIEDAAQAIGIYWNKKHCGTFGDVGCFSFFADKTITTGEGGFVVTDNEEIYDKMLYLRNQGRKNRGSFIHPEIGYNFRLTDIQSAMGLVQLRKLKEIQSKKIALLNLYEENLKDLNQIRIIKPDSSSSTHVPFRVVIMSSSPVEGLLEHFKKKNIEVRTVFYPLHKQPCYSSPRHQLYTNNKGESTLNGEWNFPNSIHAYNHGVCLPSYPSLEKDKVDYVCDTIKEYYV